MLGLDFLKLDGYRTRESVIEDLRTDGKPVIVYGTGKFAVSVAEMLLNNKIELYGFVDEEKYYHKVKVQALDNHSAYSNVSVIKMDIEGSEYAALKGAYNLIKANKPRLAICIYHKNQDIIDIFNFLKEFNYKIYLRHHSSSVEETVLYAI